MWTDTPTDPWVPFLLCSTGPQEKGWCPAGLSTLGCLPGGPGKALLGGQRGGQPGDASLLVCGAGVPSSWKLGVLKLCLPCW